MVYSSGRVQSEEGAISVVKEHRNCCSVLHFTKFHECSFIGIENLDSNINDSDSFFVINITQLCLSSYLLQTLVIGQSHRS